MAKILDGRTVRDKIAANLTKKIEKLTEVPLGRKPRLIIIQIGSLAQSNSYIKQKILFGQKIGAIVNHQKFDASIDEKKLISHITMFNQQANIDGIIVQLTIPKHLDKNRIIDSINPNKDVDGQTSINLKKLMEKDPTGFVPATTKGILTLLEYYRIPVAGKNIVIVGRSSLVGKPTALALLNKDATVTVCHSRTRNLAKVTRNADILIVAAGQPNLITKNHVSKNQVVIDVGINVLGQPINKDLLGNILDQRPESEPSGHKLVGDVNFDEVSKIVKAISPVPGGVGPMTVASLFENLLEAYRNQT